MNKKGQMMGGGRKIFSIVLGLIFLALGGIPILHKLNVIGFTLPELPWLNLVFLGLALIGAVVLIIDGFKEEQEFGAAKTIGIASILVALVLIVYALGSFEILPFAIPDVGMIIIYILFALAGLLLIIGGFIGF